MTRILSRARPRPPLSRRSSRKPITLKRPFRLLKGGARDPPSHAGGVKVAITKGGQKNWFILPSKKITHLSRFDRFMKEYDSASQRRHESPFKHRIIALRHPITGEKREFRIPAREYERLLFKNNALAGKKGLTAAMTFDLRAMLWPETLTRGRAPIEIRTKESLAREKKSLKDKENATKKT